MPDIGLLQGAPPRRREVVSSPIVPEAAREVVAAAPVSVSVTAGMRGEPGGQIAVKFAAPVARAISVEVVSEAAAAAPPAVEAAPTVAATESPAALARVPPAVNIPPAVRSAPPPIRMQD